MRDLAQEHEVHTAIGQRKCAAVGHQAGDSIIPGHSRCNRTHLESDGPKLDAALGRPGARHSGEIAGSGSDIQH